MVETTKVMFITLALLSLVLATALAWNILSEKSDSRFSNTANYPTVRNVQSPALAGYDYDYVPKSRPRADSVNAQASFEIKS